MTPDDTDREVLSAVFASRISLAKKTEDEAADEIRKERLKALEWIASTSRKVGSFLWCCDEFSLEADAVRRAVRERRK